MISRYHGIDGFDISTHQDSALIPGSVDFQKMKAYGARFCGLRASNGMTQDVDFETYRANITGVLPWFAYAYYNNLYDPHYQAQKFFNVLAPNIPPVCVLDLEDKQSGFIGWRHWYDWLVVFQRLSGLPNDRIWIYTNETYFGECSGPITAAQRAWFKQFPLWLASPYYGDPLNPNYTLVDVPSPWTETDVRMLQTGTPAIGLQAGVESLDVDYNQFQGDEQLFVSIFGGQVSQPPTGEPMPQYFKVTASVLNIRASANGADLGDFNLLLNDIVEAGPAVNDWRQIFHIWRGGQAVPFAPSPTGQYWAKGSYLAATTFTPPVVVPPPAETAHAVVTLPNGDRYEGDIPKV